jgi:hypothetical protein
MPIGAAFAAPDEAGRGRFDRGSQQHGFQDPLAVVAALDCGGPPNRLRLLSGMETRTRPRRPPHWRQLNIDYGWTPEQGPEMLLLVFRACKET